MFTYIIDFIRKRGIFCLNFELLDTGKYTAKHFAIIPLKIPKFLRNTNTWFIFPLYKYFYRSHGTLCSCSPLTKWIPASGNLTWTCRYTSRPEQEKGEGFWGEHIRFRLHCVSWSCRECLHTVLHYRISVIFCFLLFPSPAVADLVGWNKGIQCRRGDTQNG